MYSPQIFARFLTVAVTALFVSVGCGGGNNGGDDACTDVQCSSGVCDPQTGLCTNADSCTDDASCVDGFTCRDGACVSSCTTNSSCGEGLWCDDGACAPNPCADVTCERGVCQVGVGVCVNASACTSATQGEACLDAHLCVDGACVSDEEFCESLACDRGVCSTDERACVDADNCAGDDANCVEGSYCGDDNVCQVNECADGNTCGRGVCDPETGDCVDAETCSAADECVDGNVCIDGACVEAGLACGTEACPGNQVCEYDESALAAACVENAAEGCVNALDCADDRVCADGACAAPGACMADEQEPNDDAANAVDFHATANLGTLTNLSLCDSDTDVFTFNTLEDSDAEGMLVVRADILPVDVGLGTLTVELIDEDGNSVETVTNEKTAKAQLSTAIDALSNGTYTIVVSSPDVTTAGIRYSLSVDVVPMDVMMSCAAPQRISPASPVIGTTVGVSNTSLSSSCADLDGLLPEVVYQLDLTEASWVDVQVTPEVGHDALVSVRSTCTDNASEQPDGCEDRGGDGDAETLSLALGAGTHFIVVESYDPAEPGSFVLSVSAEPQICTSMSNTCVDTDTASVCNPQGTGFDDVDCPDGCDPISGACLRPAGDTCGNAITVDPQFGFDGTINLAGLQSDYDPGTASCVPQKSTFYRRTDAEDGVLVANVPAGKVLTVEAVSSANDDLSLYLATDCADVATSCVAGTDEHGYTTSQAEFVYYKNDTGAAQTVYAFVDVGSIESSVGQANVRAFIADPVCTPGERRCVLDRESQLCNAAGTAFDSTQACDNGCDLTTGACLVTNDTCGGAALLTSGVTTPATVANYTDAHEPTPADCGALSSFDTGNGAADAVFRVETTAPNQVVTVVVEPVGFDAILWVSDSCTNDTLGTCLDGVDDSESDGADETLKFLAPTAGTYYVTVQDGDSGGSVGDFDITATVAAAACTPGQILGCNTSNTGKEYCSDKGEILTYTCDVSGCDDTTGNCVDPGGDVCLDTIQLPPGSGTYSGRLTNNGTDVVDFGSGVTDRCNFDSSLDAGGDEIFHAIQLIAGDLLTVTFLDKGTNQDGEIYFQTECGSPTSCSGYVADGSQTVEYFAQQSEVVYVVVDADTTSTTAAFDYDLTWNVTQPGWVCEPNTSRCMDSTTIEACSADGFSSSMTFCATACDSGRCVDAPAKTDTCTTAPNIGAGMSLRVDLEDAHTATLDPNGATCAVDGSGPDAFFAVNALTYDLISVKATSTSILDDLAIYIFSDCNDAAGTCMAAIDQDDDLLLQHQVLTAGTFYIGIDHDSGSIYGADVGVEITVEPGCIPTDPPACSADGSALEFCTDGVTSAYACAGGCSNAACNQPRGDACFDAIPLDKQATSVAGVWTNNTNTIETSDDLVGNCLFNYAGDGVDDVYSVALAAGETITASLTSTETNALLYFVGDCADPSATCLAHTNTRDFETPISFHADAAQTIYVVVDRSDTSTDNDYTLNYTVESGLDCGVSSQCTDANTLVECNEDGTVKRQTNCTYGCVAGGCQPGPGADSCASAQDIGSGGVFTTDYDLYNDDLDFGGVCAGETEDGPDLFFSATLTENQILRIYAQSTGFEPPLVYVLGDCTGDSATCLGGAHEGSPGQVYNDGVTFEYQALADETVIIGLDNEFGTADEPVQIAFDVLTPDCDPTTFVQQCNAAGDAFQYCSERGFIREYDCQGNGTCDATSGRCAEPVGDVCIDPFDANPAAGSQTFSGTFAGFADDYDLGTGNACTMSRTIGPEPVYVVDLTAGQTLTVDAVSTAATPEDLAVYLTDECTNVRNQCLTGSDAVGAAATAETVSYTATGDEQIYIMVDSFFGNVSGTFDLTVTVN